MSGTLAPAPSRWVGDHGSTSLELVIIAPALLLVLVAVIAGGRLALTQQGVDLAAGQAARAATLARTPGAGVAGGRTQAASALAAQGLGCIAHDVQIQAAALAAPPGAPGQVTVRVACTVLLADLGVPALPGSVTIHATAHEAVDQWVAR